MYTNILFVLYCTILHWIVFYCMLKLYVLDCGVLSSVVSSHVHLNISQKYNEVKDNWSHLFCGAFLSIALVRGRFLFQNWTRARQTRRATEPDLKAFAKTKEFLPTNKRRTQASWTKCDNCGQGKRCAPRSSVQKDQKQASCT